jgi:Fe(II)/alpha-ketoglutarate-dependent arginine beta-hydroxylase
MNRILLTGEEVRSIEGLLDEVKARYTSLDDAAFLGEVSVIAHELPRRLRSFLNEFRQSEPPVGHCLVSGLPVEDAKLGATPAHWKLRSGVSPALREEILFVICGTLLGDLIGWASQQNSYLIHEVVPIKEDENAQISTGSQQDIWWHNEDAFHPYRGDYVGLMCLRNEHRVPTTLASIDAVKLSARNLKILFEPRFKLLPDESHAEKNRTDAPQDPSGSGELVESAYEHIRQMRLNPPVIPILSGDPSAPYIRIDPFFMAVPDDDEAQAALTALIRALDGCLAEIVLQPGDCLFVDNYKAVHGRKSFKAKYDGTDRWLKRINIARDLRKSRSARAHITSRVIF